MRCEQISWSPEEERLLAELWPSQGLKCLKYFPGRTKSGIGSKANLMKLKREYKPKRPKHRDIPLITKREEKRNSRSCYGYIPGGPVRSVFELGERV